MPATAHALGRSPRTTTPYAIGTAAAKTAVIGETTPIVPIASPR